MAIPPPVEAVLPRDRRDQIRADWLAESGFYNPWLHIGITTGFGGTIMVIAASLLHDVKWWEILFGVGLFVVSNAAEWRIHRDLLHKRFKLLPVLYDQHTPRHHMVFVTDDMSIRSTREFQLVLIPPYGIVAAFAGLVPAMVLIWTGTFGLFPERHNLAAVFAIVTMGYIVSYEWLHLSYHLPEDSFVGGLWIVRVLRQHHAIHHDPRLMQKWNFNVSLPLWDLVRRTYVRDRAALLASRRSPA
jgi:hypothetical protein